MKIAYFSGDEETLPILERLAEEGEVRVLVTQPPKPKGRGLKLLPSPLVLFAQKKGIKPLFPKDPNASEFIEILRKEEIEVGVLVSFGHIIKSELLNLFPKGFINLHPSLLPKYRGPAPIQRAILAGEEKSGVTTIFMNEGIDAGPIIEQRVVEIGRGETYGDLKKKLFLIGADLLLSTLRLIKEGRVKPLPQDEGEATYAQKIKKEELVISWERERDFIHNQIRAFSPKPGAFTSFRQKKVIILKSEIPKNDSDLEEPGAIIISGGDLFVGTKKGLLKIKELKVEGRGIVSGRDFVNGYKPKVGEKFE
ncbi:MAG: methionyl-tRNA formyltransferase [candidate division WOR-3 bacterium]